MQPRLRSRSDLLELIYDRAPSRGVCRAINAGRVTLLGGFSAIPPSGRPGWIVEWVSQNGARSLVAVVTDDVRHDFVVAVCDKVPWTKWVGGSPLHDGDVPERMQANKELAERLGTTDVTERSNSNQ